MENSETVTAEEWKRAMGDNRIVEMPREEPSPDRVFESLKELIEWCKQKLKGSEESRLQLLTGLEKIADEQSRLGDILDRAQRSLDAFTSESTKPTKGTGMNTTYAGGEYR